MYVSDFQVLADQAVWAVCGRVAGVINMDGSKKQTMVVEVMPLVGGHLQLPRVRLSKYIQAGNASVSSASTNDVASPPSLGTRGESLVHFSSYIGAWTLYVLDSIYLVSPVGVLSIGRIVADISQSNSWGEH